ncbi:aTP-dependent Clp protease proteolytic subunit [Clostridium sp. CAG:628]|jgi:ATP-dependent Clp protease protease subunit|nr:aTP-dependent Clp protease proteolytic subunit [Clostridium sp. CAG:628]
MVIPMIIDKEEGVEKSFDIYSKLLKERIVFLSGEITDEVANLIVSELLYLNSLGNDDIYLYINSPGGSVTAGMAIYDTMNFIKADVVTICVGMCASMGAFLLSSGCKGKRMSLKNGEVMIHQPLGGVKGQASDIQIHADRIIKMKKKLNSILASNTSKDMKVIERDTERDNYMDAKEALEYGLIDKII